MAAKSKAEGSTKPTKNLTAKSLQKIAHNPSKPSKSSVRSRVQQSTQKKVSMSLKAKNAPVKAKATPVKPVKATPVKAKATPVKPVKSTPVKAKAVLTEINIVVPTTDEKLGDTPIVKVPTPKKAPLKTFYMGPPVKIKKAKAK